MQEVVHCLESKTKQFDRWPGTTSYMPGIRCFAWIFSIGRSFTRNVGWVSFILTFRANSGGNVFNQMHHLAGYVK